MNTEDLTTRKRIPINRIKLGMFVVGLDQSWQETPFFFHRKLIRSDADIELLKLHGVHEVIIDTAQGVDLAVENDALARSEVPARSSGDVAPTTAAVPARRPSEAEIAFQPLAKELTAAQSIHAEAISAAKIIFDGARGGAPVNRAVAEEVVQTLGASILRSPEANLLLMQMHRFDQDLFTHAVNVCVLALVVNGSEGIGADPASLGLGALLHDIGETRLPRNLSRKQDGCSDGELRLVERHPEFGWELLSSGEFAEDVRRIALEHHERLDGSGYPHRVKGDEIAFASQVVAITDMYDDMMSGRNQALLAPIEVLRRLFLQGNGGALERSLVEKIIRCLGVYPIGSLVELGSGERAIVVAANKQDALKPTVRIITSRMGFMQKNGPVINLADAASGEIERRIVKALDPRKERIYPMAYLKLAPALAGK
jgi:putative nucleotidyltransferase with HDIG domain